MSKKVPKACHAALATYFDREARYRIFHKIINDTVSDRFAGRATDTLSNAVEVVSAALLSSVHDATSNLLLWMHIDPGSLPEELRAAIINKYTGHGRSLMRFLERELHHPSSYDSDDEDDFRAEIEEFIEEYMPDGWERKEVGHNND